MKKNSVLIIDDQHTNIAALTIILSSECIINSADNGRDGIKTAHEQLPDVILLDILMMDMDGYEVIKELKSSEITKNIPVIFITSLDSGEDETKGLELGAADYISKPFSEAVVKLRVNNQIRLIELQKNLEEKAKEAWNANRAKSAFLANMSHEIRTPMNVIINLTQALMEESESIPAENRRHFLQRINSAGEILLALINDILDISKIESGKLTLVPSRYELPKLLNDVTALNIFRIEDKPIVFKLNANANLYYFLHGDELRVKQIVSNLLSNAFKYTKEGEVTFEINCTRNNNYIDLEIIISDTGIGIREADLQKLFDEYNQADMEANRLIEGTGLGLPITKGLTELMGGKITVKSEYGKGTAFKVNLTQEYVSDEQIGAEIAESLRNFKHEVHSQESKKLSYPDLSYVRVLAVDDFLPNLDVAQWMFGKYKIQVDCVTSGQEAVDIMQSAETIYDAIFMDHMMPGMDGIEAVNIIRGINSEYAKTIPIIALTANAIIGNEEMFLNNGFQAFLPKPADPVRLNHIIRKWIMNEELIEHNQLSSHPAQCAHQLSTVNICGVNSETALYLFEGDVEMYKKFLRSFADYIPSETKKINNVSESNLKEYAGVVHTIKGACAGIGANELADYADRLVKLARKDDITGVIGENEKFIKEMNVLFNNVGMFLKS